MYLYNLDIKDIEHMLNGLLHLLACPGNQVKTTEASVSVARDRNKCLCNADALAAVMSAA